jgi:hypothetical protein
MPLRHLDDSSAPEALLDHRSCAVAVVAGLFYVNQAKLTVGAVEHFFAAIILVDDDLGCAIAKMAGSANSDRAATTTVLALLHEMVSFGLHRERPVFYLSGSRRVFCLR